MEKEIIEKLKDIRNRIRQAQHIFAQALRDLTEVWEGLDDDFKGNIESFVTPYGEQISSTYFETELENDCGTANDAMDGLRENVNSLAKGLEKYLLTQKENIKENRKEVMRRLTKIANKIENRISEIRSEFLKNGSDDDLNEAFMSLRREVAYDLENVWKISDDDFKYIFKNVFKSYSSACIEFSLNELTKGIRKYKALKDIEYNDKSDSDLDEEGDD